MSADGWIYIAEGSRAVRSLDARSGELCWEVETGSEEGVPYRSWHDDHPSIALTPPAPDADSLSLVVDVSVFVETLLVDDPPVDMSVVDVDELAVDVWVVNPVVLLEVEPPSSPHPEHLGATSVMDRRRDVKEKARTRRL